MYKDGGMEKWDHDLFIQVPQILKCLYQRIVM